MKRIGFVIFVLFSYLVATATLARAQYAQFYAGETTQALHYLATVQSPTAPAMQIVAGDDLYVIVSWVGSSLNDLGGVLDNLPPGGLSLTRESGECDSNKGTCIARYRITERLLVTAHATLLINNLNVPYFYVYVKECRTSSV
jgi:hypothetical protein